MVAACTAWADWKHRRATKTACDTPVGHPPPPVCTVTRVLWGKREGGCSSSVSVCIHQVWERRQMFVSTIVRRTCPRVPRPPKDSTGREMHEVSECMPWVLQAASRPPPRPRPPPPPCQRQTFLETAGFELGLLEEGFSPAFKTGRRGCPSHIRPFQRALDSRSSTCQRQSRSGRSGGAPFGFPPHTPARARAHTHTHTRTHREQCDLPRPRKASEWPQSEAVDLCMSSHLFK